MIIGHCEEGPVTPSTPFPVSTTVVCMHITCSEMDALSMERFISPMNSTFTISETLKFNVESLNYCSLPQAVPTLLIAATAEGCYLWENVRQYNSACAFTSMGTQVQLPPGNYPN